MNKYKNAGPNEKNGTFYQIICPVCGFKDATSDKESWVCPECEDKAKQKARVIEGVKTAIKSPLASPTLKAELKKYEAKLEEKRVVAKVTPEVKEVNSEAVDAFYKSIGMEPPKPAAPPAPEHVKEFKVGGLQCKIVTTKRK